MDSGARDPAMGETAKAPQGCPGKTHGSHPERNRLVEVAELLADCMLRRLPLGWCAVYLYDESRANLVKLASEGDDKSALDEIIPLSAGTPLLAFDRTSLHLPLWDGRVTLGVIVGVVGPAAAVTPALVEKGRLVAQSWAVTLSYVLEDGRFKVEAFPKPRVVAKPRASDYDFANSHLTNYLQTALTATCPEGPVSVVQVRLTSPAGGVSLPQQGMALRPMEPGTGSSPGRAFGLPGDGRAVLVWLRTDPRTVRDLVTHAAGGSLGLGTLTSSRWENTGGTPPRVDAAGLAVYNLDGASPGELLAAADDYQNLCLYLLCSDNRRNRERRESSLDQTGDATIQVMDRQVLDREIARQKEVLEQAIEEGRSFQDIEIRQISELLDRLIVVRQRHMGHRGAVP